MTIWLFRHRNCLWKIPAATRAEAERLLCACLGLASLPAEARFVGHEE